MSTLTKEEIVNSKLHEIDTEYGTYTVLYPDGAEEAMEQYAAQESRREAIGFGLWGRLNGWDLLAVEKKIWVHFDSQTVVTEDELFNRYLQSKTQ